MPPITLPEIESALEYKGKLLDFPPRLEAFYEESQRVRRGQLLWRCLLVLVVVDLLLLLLDAGSDVPMALSVHLRVGMMTPLGLCCLLILRRARSARVQGCAAILPIVMFVALQTWLAHSMGEPQGDRIMVGTGIALLMQTLTVPVPFLFAVGQWAACVTLIFTVSLAPLTRQLHAPMSIGLPLGICTICAAGLLERRRREAAERRSFLLSEANRMRMEEILRLNAHLERMSSVDGLTGIFNRRYLNAALARLWSVATENDHWLGVIMVDIDHFKLLNDTAGHQHGDFCLEQVAQILQRSVRAGIDTVARYGGEEFVAILPDFDEDEVVTVGERIRQAIEAARLPAAEGRVVTVSAGAAAIRGSATRRVRPEDFIAAADQALYEAKRSGRNRVICAVSDFASAALPPTRLAHAPPLPIPLAFASESLQVH